MKSCHISINSPGFAHGATGDMKGTSEPGPPIGPLTDGAHNVNVREAGQPQYALCAIMTGTGVTVSGVRAPEHSAR